MEVKIANNSTQTLPEYSTERSAGIDLLANLDKAIILNPLYRAFIPTGLYIEVPSGFEAQMRPRNWSAIKNEISVINTPGTIDTDYSGEVKVILVNLSNRKFIFNDSERIYQMIITKHVSDKWDEVKELNG